MLATQVDFKYGRSAHIFLTAPKTGWLPTKPDQIEFLLQTRSQGHYASVQHRPAPFGGMEEKEETLFQTLLRELKEEIIGTDYVNYEKNPQKYPLTDEQRHICTLIDNHIKSEDDLTLVHRGLNKPPNQGWSPTIDSFYILKKDFKPADYQAIKEFVLRRNASKGLENKTAGGEVSRYVTMTVRQILRQAHIGPDSAEQILSMPPEDYALHKSMHEFIYKYLQQHPLLRTFRKLSDYLCRRGSTEISPFKLRYTATKIVTINGVDTVCRVLDPNPKRQPFMSHGVVSHSRGLRFMEVAEHDRTITTKAGKVIDVKAGQIIATVMDFDAQGQLKPYRDAQGKLDVYLPTDDKDVPFTHNDIGTIFERIDPTTTHGGRVYPGSQFNGIYSRKSGLDFYCLPCAVEVPTLIGDEVFMPGDSIILRPHGKIEGMSAAIFQNTVVGIPRQIQAFHHPQANTSARREIRAATARYRIAARQARAAARKRKLAA